jgi:hypothetical protein
MCIDIHTLVLLKMINKENKMDYQKLLAILDKNINQEQLVKDLETAFLLPKLLEFKAKIDSGEIDLIKGTSLDKMALDAAIDFIIGQFK